MKRVVFLSENESKKRYIYGEGGEDGFVRGPVQALCLQCVVLLEYVCVGAICCFLFADDARVSG